MTYKEAAVLKENNIMLVGTVSDFMHHTISYLLIAPDNIEVPDITTVYKQSLLDGSNETALQNLGFFNGSMNVYVIWEPANGQLEQMPLAVYLAVAKK